MDIIDKKTKILPVTSHGQMYLFKKKIFKKYRTSILFFVSSIKSKFEKTHGTLLSHFVSRCVVKKKKKTDIIEAKCDLSRRMRILQRFLHAHLIVTS